MNAGSSATEILARRLVAIDAVDLGDDVLEEVRKRILDVAGVASLGVAPAAVTILDPCDPMRDAIALSAAVRASEADDIHAGSCVTIGSIVIPVALWTARLIGADDRRLAAAIVAGYEAGIALGLAIDGANRVYEGLWPSYFVAPFAAAATAGHLLGGADLVADALAIAATHIAGDMPAPVEPSARWLSFAFAVQNGLRSAMLAKAGLRGDPAYLDRRLARTFGAEPGLRMPAETSRQYAILETDLKPFCTARQLLAAVQAAHDAVSAHPAGTLHPEAIRAIELRVPEQCLRMVDCAEPTAAIALASGQLQVAIALVRPALLYRRDRDAGLNDPEIRAMMARISVHADPELSRRYPAEWGAVVKIDSKGKSGECAVKDPYGSYRKPLDYQAVQEKLRRMPLPDGHVATVSDLCDRLYSAGPSAGALLTTTSSLFSVGEGA